MTDESDPNRAPPEYQAIFDNAAVGIVYTRDRFFYRCNQRGAALLGYLPRELEGLPGTAIYPSQQSYQDLGLQAAPLLAAGHAFESDWQLQRKDGEPIWCHVWGRAVDPENTDLGTVWILEDATQTRQIATAHRQALAEMQAIMDNAPTAILITRDRKIVRYNPRFSEMFRYPGTSATNLPGRSLYCSDEDYDELGRQAYPLLSQGKPFHTEIFMRRADDSQLWANLTGYLLDFKNPAAGAIWLAEDRTEFKQAENTLRENLVQIKETNQRLEEAQNQLLQSEKLASIGQLAAGVAHEINNPIGFIKSNLRTLSVYGESLLRLIDTYTDIMAGVQLPADAAARLQAARQSSDIDFLRNDMRDLLRESDVVLQRVHQLVQNLRDFSHIDSFQWTPVDLNACLKNTLNMAWNDIRLKAETAFELGELPELLCNAPQIKQVILILLLNASHAIETSSVITIRSGQQDASVWFEIEDTGCGMSEAVQKRMFEPFFTTRAVGQGTGLGLSVAYGIVTQHGGEIEVWSRAGVGTRVRVRLPVTGPRVPPVA